MIVLKTPAKINLSLRVLGRRPDGYHELDSIMQMVGLYDEISIEDHPDTIAVHTSGATLPDGPGNLAYDAAAALAKAAGSARGASIRLVKRIPLGAGLGGGSSDAAAVLDGLNRLWGLGWPRARLAELGATLGSDVPFFFAGPTAHVSGRGECVRRMARPRMVGEGARCDWVVLVNPGFAVSTRWAFDALRAPPFDATFGLTKANSADTIPRSPEAPAPPYPAENSLESVTATPYPVILEMKRMLKEAGASVVLMSGSGPTVFGLFSDRRQAKAGLTTRPETWKGWVARVLRRAPW